MNNELIIYGHAGACNHGNEAIIRGLHTLLPNKKIKVFSLDPESDWLWDLPSIVEVDELRQKLPRYSPRNIIGHLLYRITKNDRYRWKFEFKNFIKQVKNKVCIFEMGDQFCEPDPYVIKMYSYLNREIHMGGG